MIIKWVDITNEVRDGFHCDSCKKEIIGKAKRIEIQYKEFGRGDDDVIILHPKCLKQKNGENHIEYAKRLLEAIKI